MQLSKFSVHRHCFAIVYECLRIKPTSKYEIGFCNSFQILQAVVIVLCLLTDVCGLVEMARRWASWLWRWALAVVVCQGMCLRAPWPRARPPGPPAPVSKPPSTTDLLASTTAPVATPRPTSMWVPPLKTSNRCLVLCLGGTRADFPLRGPASWSRPPLGEAWSFPPAKLPRFSPLSAVRSSTPPNQPRGFPFALPLGEAWPVLPPFEVASLFPPLCGALFYPSQDQPRGFPFALPTRWSVTFSPPFGVASLFTPLCGALFYPSQDQPRGYPFALPLGEAWPVLPPFEVASLFPPLCGALFYPSQDQPRGFPFALPTRWSVTFSPPFEVASLSSPLCGAHLLPYSWEKPRVSLSCTFLGAASNLIESASLFILPRPGVPFIRFAAAAFQCILFNPLLPKVLRVKFSLKRNWKDFFSIKIRNFKL